MKIKIILTSLILLIGFVANSYSAIGQKLSGQGNAKVVDSTWGKWADSEQIVVKVGSKWYTIDEADAVYVNSSLGKVSGKDEDLEITIYYPTNIKSTASAKNHSQNAKLQLKQSGNYWAKSGTTGSNCTIRVNYIDSKWVFGVFAGTVVKGNKKIDIKGNFKVAKP